MAPIQHRLITGAALLTVLALAACTEYWAKPGGSPAEFQLANSQCETQAFSLFPPAWETVLMSPGYVTPMVTSCAGAGPAMRCATTGGYFVPPAYMNVDRNQGGRASAVRSCLMAAGWRPVRDKEEAIAVSKSPPAPPPVTPPPPKRDR